MKIIPAIDILGGKCVRLSRGDYNSQKVYSERPSEIAKAIEDAGIQYLHVVDLDGAKAQRIVNHRALAEICGSTQLQVDFGGGIRTENDIRKALDHGASQVTAGSIAVSNPGRFLQWLADFGPRVLLLGADCNDRKIATHGWTEHTQLDVISFIRQYCEEGVQTVICTEIERDGMLAGPATGLYREIMSQAPVKLIASGGIASLEDLEALQAAGCAGAIIGRAIYEQKITLEELSLLC